jgi:hypothetical protein
MTAENRLVAKLGDIVLIRFECRRCHAVSAWKPSQWEKLPHSCSNCSEKWLVPGSIDESFIENLKMNIGQMARIGDKYPFEFTFEFDARSESDAERERILKREH